MLVDVLSANDEREIKNALRLASCINSQDLEALEGKKKKGFHSRLTHASVLTLTVNAFDGESDALAIKVYLQRSRKAMIIAILKRIT